MNRISDLQKYRTATQIDNKRCRWCGIILPSRKVKREHERENHRPGKPVARSDRNVTPKRAKAAYNASTYPI